MSVKRSFNCLKFSLVAVFMLFVQVLLAQGRFAGLDKVIEEKKKALGNDFSVVIADADTLLYQKHVGDVQPKTPFDIGASSQWLTTALVMQLVDEGKISLDDPVAKYIPAFELYRRNYVTIRHCLTHQTGLGKEGFRPAAIFDKQKFKTREDEMTSMLKKEIHANAGEEFRYTNYGMAAAAYVVEIVTKKRFDQIIRTRLFVPMTMRNTTFTTDDGSVPNAANGAKSTAVDYAKFLQMLLNGGTYAGKQILSKEAVEEMRKIQVSKDQVKNVPAAAQGFGFALGTWAMDGGTAGAPASAIVLPSLDGSWPVVDFGRRYVFVVLAKKFSGDQRQDLYNELKALADQGVPAKR
jgi:CubicO group peptidase (beta-lactamase class C family)